MSETQEEQSISAQDPEALLASLIEFGPSHDGSVERDLKAAIADLKRRALQEISLEQTKNGEPFLAMEGDDIYWSQYEAYENFNPDYDEEEEEEGYYLSGGGQPCVYSPKPERAFTLPAIFKEIGGEDNE